MDDTYPGKIFAGVPQAEAQYPEAELGEFSEFYRTHERLVRSRLFHWIGRPAGLDGRALLDDLVQQVFIKCWENRRQFRGQAKLSTWVTQIALNLARDHWRKEKRAPWSAAQSLDDDTLSVRGGSEVPPETSTDSLSDRLAVERALESLDFEHRSVLVLRYFQDLPLEEIAEITGDPLGTVKSRLHYAKNQIRARLEKMGVLL